MSQNNNFQSAIDYLKGIKPVHKGGCGIISHSKKKKEKPIRGFLKGLPDGLLIFEGNDILHYSKIFSPGNRQIVIETFGDLGIKSKKQFAKATLFLKEDEADSNITVKDAMKQIESPFIRSELQKVINKDGK